jgi:hypothetical protein
MACSRVGRARSSFPTSLGLKASMTLEIASPVVGRA